MVSRRLLGIKRRTPWTSWGRSCKGSSPPSRQSTLPSCGWILANSVWSAPSFSSQTLAIPTCSPCFGTNLIMKAVDPSTSALLPSRWSAWLLRWKATSVILVSRWTSTKTCPEPRHDHGPKQEGVDQAYWWWWADQHPSWEGRLVGGGTCVAPGLGSGLSSADSALAGMFAVCLMPCWPERCWYRERQRPVTPPLPTCATLCPRAKRAVSTPTTTSF